MVETVFLSPPPKRYTLNSVQVLRAFAALSVMAGHLFVELRQSSGAELDVIGFPWPSGVDIFFVISGFVMIYTNHEAFGEKGAPWAFIRKRLVRIVPLYYLFTTLMILLVVLMPQVFDTARYDVGQFVSSYLFWPYERYDGAVRPILSLGWTLNYEMFFYALFACALLFPLRLGLAGLVVLMTGLVAARPLFGIDGQPFSFWFSPIILEFCFGLLIGIAFVKYGKIDLGGWRNALPFLLAPAAFFLFGSADADPWLPNFIAWGVPAAALVFACVMFLPWEREVAVPRFAVALGDSSYALYLAHPFIYNGVLLVLYKSVPSVQAWPWVVFFVCLGATVAGAHLVHLLIEKPMLNLLR
ncbi:MAG: acyltransferase [Parvibaculum sp.]|nr:acyltransferase [Parvibaculum sp.]